MQANPITVTWHSANRPPREPPNPAYPDGMEIDLAGEAAGCVVALPYPAECRGVWLVACSVCGLSVGITAAGRPDDPRSARIPCKLAGEA